MLEREDGWRSESKIRMSCLCEIERQSVDRGRRNDRVISWLHEKRASPEVTAHAATCRPKWWKWWRDILWLANKWRKADNAKHRSRSAHVWFESASSRLWIDRRPITRQRNWWESAKSIFRIEEKETKKLDQDAFVANNRFVRRSSAMKLKMNHTQCIENAMFE